MTTHEKKEFTLSRSPPPRYPLEIDSVRSERFHLSSLLFPRRRRPHDGFPNCTKGKVPIKFKKWRKGWPVLLLQTRVAVESGILDLSLSSSWTMGCRQTKGFFEFSITIRQRLSPSRSQYLCARSNFRRQVRNSTEKQKAMGNRVLFVDCALSSQSTCDGIAHKTRFLFDRRSENFNFDAPGLVHYFPFKKSTKNFSHQNFSTSCSYSHQWRNTTCNSAFICECTRERRKDKHYRVPLTHW